MAGEEAEGSKAQRGEVRALRPQSPRKPPKDFKQGSGRKTLKCSSGCRVGNRPQGHCRSWQDQTGDTAQGLTQDGASRSCLDQAAKLRSGTRRGGKEFLPGPWALLPPQPLGSKGSTRGQAWISDGPYTRQPCLGQSPLPAVVGDVPTRSLARESSEDEDLRLWSSKSILLLCAPNHPG